MPKSSCTHSWATYSAKGKLVSRECAWCGVREVLAKPAPPKVRATSKPKLQSATKGVSKRVDVTPRAQLLAQPVPPPFPPASPVPTTPPAPAPMQMRRVGPEGETTNAPEPDPQRRTPRVQVAPDVVFVDARMLLVRALGTCVLDVRFETHGWLVDEPRAVVGLA